jgi:hypothetical protein
MHDILVVLVHSIVTVVRLIKPGGLRAVDAESALTRPRPRQTRSVSSAAASELPWHRREAVPPQVVRSNGKSRISNIITPSSLIQLRFRLVNGYRTLNGAGLRPRGEVRSGTSPVSHFKTVIGKHCLQPGTQ